MKHTFVLDSLSCLHLEVIGTHKHIFSKVSQAKAMLLRPMKDIYYQVFYTMYVLA